MMNNGRMELVRVRLADNLASAPYGQYPEGSALKIHSKLDAALNATVLILNSTIDAAATVADQMFLGWGDDGREYFPSEVQIHTCGFRCR